MRHHNLIHLTDVADDRGDPQPRPSPEEQLYETRLELYDNRHGDDEYQRCAGELA